PAPRPTGVGPRGSNRWTGLSLVPLVLPRAVDGVALERSFAAPDVAHELSTCGAIGFAVAMIPPLWLEVKAPAMFERWRVGGVRRERTDNHVRRCDFCGGTHHRVHRLHRVFPILFLFLFLFP